MTGWTQEKAAKWNKYASPVSNNSGSPLISSGGWSPQKAAKWDKYAAPSIQDNGDSWGTLGAKAGWKGAVAPLLDLPSLAARGVEAIAVSKANRDTNLYSKLRGSNNLPQVEDTDVLSSRLPTSHDAEKFIRNQTGVDLEPHPTTSGQRVFTKGAETAAAFLPWNLTGKAGLVQKGANALKGATLGAGIGATSGVLQEEGMSPLAADITGAIGVPTATGLLGKTGKATKSLLGNFTQAGRQGKLDTDVGNTLRKHIGEKNLPQVMERLEGSMPLGAEPTTAELAQNVGVSKLHQALEANNPAVLERQALNDEILKKELTNISPRYEASEPELLQNRHENLIAKRKSISEPLYETVRELDRSTPTPNLLALIDKRLKFAIGDKKKELESVKKIILNPHAESQLKSIDKKHSDLSAEARNELKQYVSNEAPIGTLAELVQDLNGKIEVAYKQGDTKRAQYLKEIKTELEKDLSAAPEELAARAAYSANSPSINAIEMQPTLFSKTTKLPKVKALMKQIQSDPETTEILRGSIVRDLLGKIELSSSNALGKENLSYDKLNKFLKSNQPKLKVIFEPEQLKILHDARDILKKRNIAASMGRARGSVTQSETTLLAGLATTGAGKLMREALGYAIPGGGLVYDAGTKAYKEAYNQALQDLLKEALTDPKKAKLLLAKSKKPMDQKTTDFLLNKIVPSIPYIASNNLQAGGE